MAADTTAKPPINVDYFEDLTGDIHARSEPAYDQIGDRIKRIREEKGLSIVELSQLTGFDRNMLEDIENNRLCPQLGTMIKLSKALDSALQRLISEEGRKIYAVTRRTERNIVSRSTAKNSEKPAYTYMSLAPDVKGRHMEALIVHLGQLPEDERSVHAGEEFIYVLEGRVKLDIGDDHVVLEPGDSVYYLSTVPHLLSAQKDRATILAVIYSE
jgi:quercetin dioxygenase-like cupin family protein/DNA-binding XRE family transcriptional regulator